MIAERLTRYTPVERADFASQDLIQGETPFFQFLATDIENVAAFMEIEVGQLTQLTTGYQDQDIDPNWVVLASEGDFRLFLYESKSYRRVGYLPGETNFVIGQKERFPFSEPFELLFCEVSNVIEDETGLKNALESVRKNLQLGGRACLFLDIGADQEEIQAGLLRLPEIIEKCKEHGLSPRKWSVVREQSKDVRKALIAVERERCLQDMADYASGTQAAQIHSVHPRAFTVHSATVGEWSLNKTNGEWESGMYAMEGWQSPEEFENNMAFLEEGKFAISAASGRSAINLVLDAFLDPENGLVVMGQLNGATEEFVFGKSSPLRRMRVPVYQFSTDDLEGLAKAASGIKIVWVETPSNPLLQVADISKLASISHEKEMVLAVDNSFMTPICQKPLKLGADISVASASKYLGGHLVTTGGIIVCREEKLAKTLRKNSHLWGPTMWPQQAVEINVGLQSLGPRMERHNENALAIAQKLEEYHFPVVYPGLPSHPQYELAKRQQNGYGGGIVLVDFGSEDLARTFMRRCRLPMKAVSFGSPKTLIEMPYYMTHRRMPQEKKERFGIKPSHVRISAGLEDMTDLVIDIEIALRGVARRRERLY